MTSKTIIRQIYYIGTGALGAMFTLRMTRRIEGGSHDDIVNRFVPDNHLFNLAAAGEENGERAKEKAKAYVDAIRERMGEREDFRVEFGGIWDDAVNTRRGKLSVRDTHNLEMIEAGKFPFGKHAGTIIADAPASYVLYFADKLPTANEPVIYALCAACQSVALEKGYIEARTVAREERRALDEQSSFVGTIGERREFTGEVITAVFKRYFHDTPDRGFWINKVRMGTDLIACIGSKQLGNVGETVTFKATIKGHDDYKGIKSTKVNRPVIL